MTKIRRQDHHIIHNPQEQSYDLGIRPFSRGYSYLRGKRSEFKTGAPSRGNSRLYYIQEYQGGSYIISLGSQENHSLEKGEYNPWKGQTWV